MIKNTTSFQPYSPGVLSLLPLYYIGWADSLLSPSEVKLINNKIAQLPFLEKADLKLLETWSDPAKPPSKELFRHWLTLLKSTADKLPKNTSQSMANLGVEMAKQSAMGDKALLWSSQQTRTALENLETSLGGAESDTIESIFSSPITEEHPPFDVSALTKLLDDDYHEIRNKMRALLSDHEFKITLHKDKEAHRAHVLQWCKALAKQGLGALAFGKAYGGKDDMGSYAAIFEMLGYHDLSLTIKFGVQFGLFGGSVQWLGTEKHHEKYLKDIGSMALPGCFAMTELGHGSNVRALETTATYHHNNKTIVINSPTPTAGKDYIGNAANHGIMATVFAQLIVNGVQHGVHAVLVPIRDAATEKPMPGVRIEDCGYKLGLNGVDNGRIWFDQVSVPAENLLNRFGDIDANGSYTSPITNPSRRFFTMLGTLVGGRACVPQAGLSAAKSGLTIAIKYALERRQFAPSDDQAETLLLDYPTHQHRLMPRLAKAYALDIALTYLTKRYVARTDDDIREIETMAAGLKSYATWFTTSTLQECREACGGKGYLAENRLAELKADTDIFTTFEGDNTVLMQLVAKGLISTFKASFHDNGFMTVAKIITSKVTTSITERNPYMVRKTDTHHLLDSEFHLAAFHYRERSILLSLTQRMRKILSKTRDPNAVFLRCQTHMMELANAYVEHIVLQQFVAAIDRADENVKPILSTLCHLYALSTMEENKGWYLESGYMEGTKTKAIRRMVSKLCKEVRKDAKYLVEAFAIPKECLVAPIAV